MALQGAILDIDGTLVLSNDAQAKAWVEAFNAFGYGATFEQVRPLIGMGGDHLVSQIVPAFDSEEGSGKAIADRRKELILNQYSANLSAANGARELVLKMKESGLKLVAATSATSEELDVLLKAADVEDLLPEATTIDDAEASKPSPDIVEAALHKAQMAPTDVVMLGDTPYDIEAANKAGVKTIAFRCGGFSDEDLSGAIAIYNDPADLLAQYDQSPLAEQAGQTRANEMQGRKTQGSKQGSEMQGSEMQANETKINGAQANESQVNPAQAIGVHPDQLTSEIDTLRNELSTSEVSQDGRKLANQINAFLDQFFQSTGQFARTNQRALRGIGLILAVLIATKILFAMLDALDDIPLLPTLLELIGVSYAIWFTSRYMMKASTRQELVQKLQSAKRKVVG